MRIKDLLLPCLALLFLMSACCKDVEYDLPPSYIDHFFFPTGSEWIMENNVTGQEDTLRITRSYMGVFDLCSGGSIECDQGNCDDKIRSQNLNMEFSSNFIEPDSAPGGVWTTMGFDGEEYGVVLYQERVFIDPVPGNTVEDLSFTTTHPNLTIQNAVFTNVSEFRDNDSHFFDGGAANYFFAENVGLIKLEDVSSGEMWEVTSWHH